jgi:hypothetical protein
MEILGCVYDSKLNFAPHIDKMMSKIKPAVAVFRRLKSYVSSRGASKLFKAHVRSRMEYAPLAWASASSTQLNRLQLISDSCGNLCGQTFDKLELRRRIARIGFMHRLVNNRVRPRLLTVKPKQRLLTGMRTRTTINNNLQLEQVRPKKNCTRRSWLYEGVRDWNSLPSIITSIENVSTLQSECVRIWRPQASTSA